MESCIISAVIFVCGRNNNVFLTKSIKLVVARRKRFCSTTKSMWLEQLLLPMEQQSLENNRNHNNIFQSFIYENSSASPPPRSVEMETPFDCRQSLRNEWVGSSQYGEIICNAIAANLHGKTCNRIDVYSNAVQINVSFPPTPPPPCRLISKPRLCLADPIFSRLP